MKKISPISSSYKIGFLGGGQLGKMLALAAANWDVQTYMLDSSKDFPAGTVCTKFVEGNFKNYDDVYNFGKQMDVLSIEIEHVNTDALLQLEKEGIKVHPKPSALNIIKDKGLQKQFYKEHNLPTASFQLYESGAAVKAELASGALSYPFVQKTRTAGYDGKGVAVIRSAADDDKVLPVACLVEPLVKIKKELAVIVARNEAGQITTFPCVEMEFHPTANLVEYLICPARVSDDIADRADALAKKIIEAFDICGILAVELFLTPDDELVINEVAPRPHNSGHHTIDSCFTSQFQQHLRAIMNLPLGNTDIKVPAVMVNLLGADGHTGAVQYEGLSEVMAMNGVELHIYGKAITKPFRKMGHATILDKDIERAKVTAGKVKDTLQIVS